MHNQLLRFTVLALAAAALGWALSAGGPGGAGGSNGAGFRPLQPLPTETPVPNIESLSYRSLRCRGTCPVMSVTFAADGTFEYVGELHVERVGEFTGRVDTFALEQVMRYVEAIDLRSMADTYPSSYSDIHTTFVTIDWGNEVKVIENQGNSAPVTVWALERLLLGLLDDATWD